MSDDTVNITVDGQTLSARKGQMLIEVTDAAGIDIPRFCYHKKLSVAANCRMCLVEVEKAPKPLPACATPVMPDMIVRTKSPGAIAAQKGTMEFLLINHPLDCPICDQGGECELQDVAMGYGGSASQYTEGKRVVMDKYIGPLIATEMTRCIHCTRCVRFGEEIAGIRELGATGRGEHVRIGTYIEKSVVSEVSGNVIDICPVGALTARPSRFTARAWELKQVPQISVHDAIGANTWLHLDGVQPNRVVPRENEAINETWIADRDRFSYQALSSPDRVLAPLVRDADGVLQTVDWPTALSRAAECLSGGELGTLVSPTLSLEELYLAQKLTRALGSNHVDHRSMQSDFRADEAMPVMPWLGMEISDLARLNAALLIGSNIRKEQPLAGVRLRKAALNGARISFLNPRSVPLHFEAHVECVVHPARWVSELAAIASAAGASLDGLNGLERFAVEDRHVAIADSLKVDGRRAILIGSTATAFPALSELLTLAARLADATGATLSLIPDYGNSAGAWLAGAIPHRSAGGAAVISRGHTARELLKGACNRLLLMGVEPEYDAADPALARATLKKADAVVALSAFLAPSLAEHADVVLPIAAPSEAHGTWVNATGQWQSVKGSLPPPGEARPGWKVLRVLADTLQLSGFEYNDPTSITSEVQAACAQVRLDAGALAGLSLEAHRFESADLLRAGATPIYAGDALVRRSAALQNTFDARDAAKLRLGPGTVQSLGLDNAETVKVTQGTASIECALTLDALLPDGVVWLNGALPETATLGPLYGSLTVSRS